MKNPIERDELPLWRGVAMGTFGFNIAAVLALAVVEHHYDYFILAMTCFAFAAPLIGYVGVCLYSITECKYEKVQAGSAYAILVFFMIGVLLSVVGYFALIMPYGEWLRWFGTAGMLLGIGLIWLTRRDLRRK